MTVQTGFWPEIEHQLERIGTEKPDTFDAVHAILQDEQYAEIRRERGRTASLPSSPDTAFFAGSGGEETLLDALERAGWRIRSWRAGYHYVMRHRRTGEVLTYTEGDVQRGDLID